MKRYNAKEKAAYAAGVKRVSGRGAYKVRSSARSKPVRARRSRASAASAASSSSGGWLAPALSAVGSAILPGIGGPIGAGLGSLIKSVTGFGDYKVQENSLIPEAGSPPAVQNSAGGKVTIIRHREYLADVVSSATIGAFKVDNYYINPGVVASFPWLAGIAANYEHYQIRGMLYEFKTMSSDALNSTNTALGQVIMATNYNASLANFASKYEMENYEFGQSIKPSMSCIHPIECKRSESVLGDLYVRPGSVPSGTDQRLYDFGNFQIASNGLQAASVNLGELWVTYEIAFYKPKLWTGLGNAVQIYQVSSSGGNANLPINTGTNVTVNTTNTLSLSYSTVSNKTRIVFPASVKYGQYFVKYSFTGTSTAALSITGFTAVSGCTFSGGLQTPSNAVTTDSFTVSSVLTVTASAPTFDINLQGTVPAGTTLQSLFIIQVPSTFV